MPLTKADLRTEAEPEALRVTRARALTCNGDAEAVARLEADRPWVTVARRWRIRRELGSRVVLIWRVALEVADGTTVEARLIAIALELNDAERRRRSRQSLEHIIRQIEPRLHAELDRATAEWQRTAEASVQAFASARTARRRAIVRHMANSGAREYQPGLFDRRADRARHLMAAQAAGADAAAAQQLAAAEVFGAIARRPAQLLLVLAP